MILYRVSKVTAKESVLNIFYFCKLDIPVDLQKVCLLISPFQHANCTTVTIDEIVSTINQWSQFPFISFKEEKPQPLRGIDGYVLHIHIIIYNE